MLESDGSIIKSTLNNKNKWSTFSFAGAIMWYEQS